MSSNGICFDIGTTTQTALHYFEQTNRYNSLLICSIYIL